MESPYPKRYKEMRERLVSLLQDEFEVVGAFEHGRALIEAELTMQPDLGVVDISMPGLCGVDAAVQLRARGSKTKVVVVVLTVYDDADFLEAALTRCVSLRCKKQNDLGFVPSHP